VQYIKLPLTCVPLSQLGDGITLRCVIVQLDVDVPMRRVRCIACGRIGQRDLSPQELHRIERGAKLVCSDPNCRGEGVVFFPPDTDEPAERREAKTSIVVAGQLNQSD
jgi:hypothetical protein